MPTNIVEPMTFRPVLGAPVVKSVWATRSPIAPRFSDREWADAGAMPIPQGFLMVKNDHNFLYLLLDLVKDTGNDAGVGDYFWLSFDVDGNASITPRRDVNYGIYPELPIRIGEQFYLGPGTWTGLLKRPTQSLARQEFGASLHSRTNHRIWELRIDLREVGANLMHVTLPPVLHFGLRTSSTTPLLTSDFPTKFFEDFKHLPGILLAMTAPLPSIGKPVAGVGLIPLGDGVAGHDGINATTGRATTASGYYLPVKDAAFGGVLNFIGDKTILENLWNQNVKKYCLKIKGTQQFLVESWTNYHFKNNEWVYEHFVPDGDGFYDLRQPSETYSIDHLLFQWNTTGIPPGIHDLEIDFINPAGTVVNTQSLRLMIDNNLPDVEILEIQYKNKPVNACDIVSVDASADPVKVHYKAFDVEGDVYSFGLDAYHGYNKLDRLIPPTLPTDGHGVADAWLSAPVNPKFPSETCAYELRLWATANVVNGYSYIGYTEATEHVTFLCPQAPPFKVLATKEVFPVGLQTIDKRTGTIIK
jgi:hypothetical protein